MPRFRSDQEEFELDDDPRSSREDAAPGDAAPAGKKRTLNFQDEFEADTFFRRVAEDPYSLTLLRRHAVENLPGYIFQQNQTNAEFIKERANRLHLLDEPLFKALHPRELELLSGEGQKRPEPDAPSAPMKEGIQDAEVAWIKFQVIDDETERPYPGVSLRIRDSANWIKQQTTNERGIAHIKKVEPGKCDLFSEYSPTESADRVALTETFHVVRVDMGEELETEAADSEGRTHLADIDDRKVKSGDSIASLAGANSMTWQNLAWFNWTTDVPDDVNDHLAYDVGCTRKTADGNNYIFSDADDPGIMYIPREFKKTGLATEQTHIIRVRRIAPNRELLVVLDDPYLGLYKGVAVDITYEDGTKLQLSSDQKAEIKIEAKHGSYIDAKYESDGVVEDRRIFVRPPGVEDDNGIWQRLVNLGYIWGDKPNSAPDDPEDLAMGLEEFQAEHDLDPTGELDSATRQAVRKAHDQDQREWEERDWFEEPAASEADPGTKANIA